MLIRERRNQFSVTSPTCELANTDPVQICPSRRRNQPAGLGATAIHLVTGPQRIRKHRKSGQTLG